MKRLKALKKAFKTIFSNPRKKDNIIASSLMGSFLGSYLGKAGLGAGIGIVAATLPELKNLKKHYKANMKEEIMMPSSNIIKPRNKPTPRGYAFQQPGKRVTSGVTIGAHNISGKKSFYQTSLSPSFQRIKRKLNITESIKAKNYLKSLAKYHIDNATEKSSLVFLYARVAGFDRPKDSHWSLSIPELQKRISKWQKRKSLKGKGKS